MWLLLILMFGLTWLILYLIAGPQRVPEYTEIKRENGAVLYFVNGFLTPEKPKPRPFLQRLVDKDGLFGGWDNRGRGADG